MALKKTTHLYEVMLRFGADGFQAAHMVEIETVTEGERVISATELPAQPVTEKEARSLIGAQSAKLVETADKARAAAHEADKRAAADREKAEELERDLAHANEALDQSIAAGNALNERLAALHREMEKAAETSDA